MQIEYTEDESRIRWERGGEWHEADIEDLIDAFEPKRGRWIYSTDIVGFGRCENCKALWDVSLIRNKFFKHCPRCGHPMERSEDER